MVLSDKALYPVLVLNSIRSQNLKTIKLRTEYKTSTKAEINNVIVIFFHQNIYMLQSQLVYTRTQNVYKFRTEVKH